jgi:hypothetical protein
VKGIKYYVVEVLGIRPAHVPPSLPSMHAPALIHGCRHTIDRAHARLHSVCVRAAHTAFVHVLPLFLCALPSAVVRACTGCRSCLHRLSFAPAPAIVHARTHCQRRLTCALVWACLRSTHPMPAFVPSFTLACVFDSPVALFAMDCACVRLACALAHAGLCVRLAHALVRASLCAHSRLPTSVCVLACWSPGAQIWGFPM